MPPQISIIPATPADLTRLQQISRQTFAETFSELNSEENMRKYLEEALSLEKLGEELRDENSIFHFAESEGRVIGYLKLNFGRSQTEDLGDNSLEIERIYVLREYLGKKVGQLLLQRALDVARERKAEFVWLGVWEKNERAIHFYRKNGFGVFGSHVFMLGDDAQTDLKMKLVMVKGPEEENNRMEAMKTVVNMGNDIGKA